MPTLLDSERATFCLVVLCIHTIHRCDVVSIFFFASFALVTSLVGSIDHASGIGFAMQSMYEYRYGKVKGHLVLQNHSLMTKRCFSWTTGLPGKTQTQPIVKTHNENNIRYQSLWILSLKATSHGTPPSHSPKAKSTQT
jgi:hypothetical protein